MPPAPAPFTPPAPAHPFTVGVAPGGLPLLGHAVKLLREPMRFLQGLPASGDLVEIRLGPQRAYVPCHPELLRQVLVEDRTFDKGGPLIENVRKPLGDGLGTCPHSKHRRQRRLIQPAFQRTHLADYAPVMEQETATLIDPWRDGQTVDTYPAFYDYALTTLARAMFSTESAVEAAEEVKRWFETVLRSSFRRMFVPEVLQALPTPGNRRYRRAIRQLNESVDRVVADYRQAGVDHKDLLSLLIAAREADGAAGFDDVEIREQVLTMLVAGSGSTAAALCWALHLLAENPEVEQRLHQEVDGVLGSRLATWQDLPHLDFTNRVLQEAMRLYPPGYLFTRTTSVNTELAGRTLPIGSTLLYSALVVHGRDDVYEHPQRFDPDRWLPDRVTSLQRGGFTAFGGGARKCIGDQFALAQTTLALASLTARWRLTHAPGSDPRPAALSTVFHPRRLTMLLTAR